MTTEAARAYLEEARWPNGVVCPACDSAKVHPRYSRPGLHRCQACEYEFTVRSGTIMEHSRVPLEKWVGVLAHWPSLSLTEVILFTNLRHRVAQEMLTQICNAYQILRNFGELSLGDTSVTSDTFVNRILSYRPPPKSAAAKRRLRERKQREFAEQQQ